MGIGFVIFMHLIGIFIVCCILAFILGLVTFLASDKKRQFRNVLLAIAIPFVGLYSMYFVWLFGRIIVSEGKGVDVGVGDTWRVPLSESCELLFIDAPEHSSIRCGEGPVIADIEFIQQSGDKVFGQTYDGKQFLFNASAIELKEFANDEEFQRQIAEEKIELKGAWDFYRERSDDATGFSFTIVNGIAVIAGLSFAGALVSLGINKRK